MKIRLASLFLLVSIFQTGLLHAQALQQPVVPWIEAIGSGAVEQNFLGRYLTMLRDGRLYTTNTNLTLFWTDGYRSPLLPVTESADSDVFFDAVIDGVRIPHPLAGYDFSTTGARPQLRTRLKASAQIVQSDLTGVIYDAAYVNFTGETMGIHRDEVDGPYPFAGAIFYRREDNLSVKRIIPATSGVMYMPTGQLVLGVKNGMDVVYGMDSNNRDATRRVYAVENANDPDKAVLKTLHEFGADQYGNGVAPNAMLLGSDGYLYGLIAYWRGLPFYPGTLTAPGTPTGFLFRLNPEQSGSYEVLHTFTVEEGELTYYRDVSTLNRPSETSIFQDYQYALPNEGSQKSLSWLVEAPDGKIYGSLGWAECRYAVRRKDEMHKADIRDGMEYSERDRCGVPARNENSIQDSNYFKDEDRVLYVDDSPPLSMQYPHHDILVDGKPYYGALYRVDRNGDNFQILHRFDNETGAYPIGPMVVADDGNVYGTTMFGGAPWERFFKWENPRDLDADPIITEYPHRPEGPQYRDGVLYRIVPDRIRQDADGALIDGGFELLHTLRECCDYAENTTGGWPVGLTKGRDGSLYMTARGGPWRQARALPDVRLGGYGYGVTSLSRQKINFSGEPSDAVVTLTLSVTRVIEGESTVIAWESSQSVRSCVGHGGFDNPAWQTSHLPYGELTLTPPRSPGGQAYTFYMECEDTAATNADGSPRKVFSNYAQLYVNLSGMEVVADDKDYGNGGGALGWLALLLGGGVAAVRCRASAAYRRKFLS